MSTFDIRADVRRIKDEIDRVTDPRWMTAEEALEFYDILIADCEASEEALKVELVRIYSSIRTRRMDKDQPCIRHR